jgi:hypothetical protein
MHGQTHEDRGTKIWTHSYQESSPMNPEECLPLNRMNPTFTMIKQPMATLLAGSSYPKTKNWREISPVFSFTAKSFCLQYTECQLSAGGRGPVVRDVASRIRWRLTAFLVSSSAFLTVYREFRLCLSVLDCLHGPSRAWIQQPNTRIGVSLPHYNNLDNGIANLWKAPPLLGSSSRWLFLSFEGSCDSFPLENQQSLDCQEITFDSYSNDTLTASWIPTIVFVDLTKPHHEPGSSEKLHAETQPFS